MSDEKIIKIESATVQGTVTETGGGAVIQGDVHTTGGSVVGRDDQRFSPTATASNITFGNQDNAILMNAIITMGERINTRINGLELKLDDLPKRVGVLELKPVPVPVAVALAFPPTFWALIVLITLGLLALAFFVGRGI